MYWSELQRAIGVSFKGAVGLGDRSLEPETFGLELERFGLEPETFGLERRGGGAVVLALGRRGAERRRAAP